MPPLNRASSAARYFVRRGRERGVALAAAICFDRRTMTVMCLRIIGIVLASTLIASSGPGIGHTKEPDAPELRADHGRIRISASECKVDMDEVFDDESGKMAAHLCKLRATHKIARDRLRAALATLVATYKDFTNHDHAKNLPVTIEALQKMVSDCLRALESQQ